MDRPTKNIQLLSIIIILVVTLQLNDKYDVLEDIHKYTKPCWQQYRKQNNALRTYNNWHDDHRSCKGDPQQIWVGAGLFPSRRFPKLVYIFRTSSAHSSTNPNAQPNPHQDGTYVPPSIHPFDRLDVYESSTYAPDHHHPYSNDHNLHVF